MLLTGDLNTGLHYRDQPGADFECADLMAEFESRGWRDAWIERNRDQRPPISFMTTAKIGIRLDYAYLSPKAPRARDVDYVEVLNGRRIAFHVACCQIMPLS